MALGLHRTWSAISSNDSHVASSRGPVPRAALASDLPSSMPSSMHTGARLLCKASQDVRCSRLASRCMATVKSTHRTRQGWLRNLYRYERRNPYSTGPNSPTIRSDLSPRQVSYAGARSNGRSVLGPSEPAGTPSRNRSALSVGPRCLGLGELVLLRRGASRLGKLEGDVLRLLGR